MKLYEFFGALSSLESPNVKDQSEQGKTLEQEKQLRDEIFFHVIDHDNLHKKHFYDVVEEIAKNKDAEKSVWSQLVTDGCMDFYHTHKMQEDPKDVFTKKFREELCEQLDDHYRKDIVNGEYKV